MDRAFSRARRSVGAGKVSNKWRLVQISTTMSILEGPKDMFPFCSKARRRKGATGVVREM